MRINFLFIPAMLLVHSAVAQNATSSVAASPTTVAPVVTAAPTSSDATGSNASASSVSSFSSDPTRTLIVDYKSVYDAPTLEDEVRMAAERFRLTPDQQDIWMSAARDRRAAEKQVQPIIDSKADRWEKDGAYRGLRTAHNNFHNAIVGYLNPAQKQALEEDRLILAEKENKLAKLPPAPPVPAVTVTPVDSSATKEPDTKATKKSKKKKKKASAG